MRHWVTQQSWQQQPSRARCPPPQAPPLHSTPIHTSSRMTDQQYEDRGGTLQRLSDEMSPYFVGPMPPQVFLDTFLPPSKPSSNASPFKKGMFSALVKASLESEMYQKFVCFRTLLFPEINPIFID